MKVKLECSDANRPILENLLLSQGVVLDNKATVVFKEVSQREDKVPLSLTFDSANPAALLTFLSEAKILGNKHNLNNNRGPGKEISESVEQSTEILLGRNGDCYEVMKVAEIFYFYAEGDFIFCRTKTGSFEVKKKLYQLEEDFGNRGFIRISKSIIINIMTITEVVPWFGGRLLLRIAALKDKLEVSRSYVKSFKSYLGM